MGSLDQAAPALSATYPTRSLEFLNHEVNVSENRATEAKESQAKVVLNVIIVGAGLGGLATAVALARQGHKVKVLEQAHALAEVQCRHPRRLNCRSCADDMKGRRGHSDTIQLEPDLVEMGSGTFPQEQSRRA